MFPEYIESNSFLVILYAVSPACPQIPDKLKEIPYSQFCSKKLVLKSVSFFAIYASSACCVVPNNFCTLTNTCFTDRRMNDL